MLVKYAYRAPILKPASLLRSRKVIAANPLRLQSFSAALMILTRFLTATASLWILMLSRLSRKRSLHRASAEICVSRSKVLNDRSFSI